jgi:iron complex outermembrane receptor protein
MHRYVAAIFILLGVSQVKAQIPGVIMGRVADNTTDEALAGVYVIYGRHLGTTTDENGYFSFTTQTGKQAVIFQLIGYGTVSREVNVTQGDTLRLDVEMELKIKEIEQIVVSAGKTEQKIAELTVSLNIIKPSFLSGNHIIDAQEIINKTTGIEVMDGQASVRGGSGFSYGAGSRVLALIDGLPVLSADAGNIRWQFLPLENLSQIEVIKGASSVLYGSSALNGIINFRTADATNIPETRFFVEAGVFDKPGNKNWIWWDTPRLFTTASVSHLRKLGRTDLGIGGYLLADEGYRRLNGEKLGRISLKLKHFNSKVQGLNYGVGINTGTTVKKDFVIWENAETGALKQPEFATAEIHGTFAAIDPFITWSKSGRFRHDLKMRFQSTINRFPESEQTNSDAYSIYTEYQLWHKLTDYLDLTAGVSENFSIINSNMYNDHTGINVAGYTQFEFRPLYRLKAVAGIRLEQNSLDGINDKLVPVLRAGLNWQAADFTFLRASFGQGYRYPSIAEKHASTTLGSVTIFPNPGILPESGWSLETGVKQGLSFGEITGQIDASLFMSENINMIEYFLSFYTDPETNTASTGFKATNIGQSRVYGGEAEILLTRSFGKLNSTFTAGYTYIYPVEFNPSTNKNTGIYLKYRRKHSGKASLYIAWQKLFSEINLYARSKILRIDDFFLNEITGEAILPGFPEYWKTHNTGYFQADATAGYRLNDRFTVSLSVKNFTNTEFMGRPGDIQPQRNFSLRFSGKI